MMEAPALQFSRIAKAFSGVPVIRDVSFSVGAGRVVGLVGENGAGKSTLMNLLGGNLRPDAGAMLIDGVPHAPNSPAEAAKAGVAFVHQELNLFPNLSIAENIFLGEFPVRGPASFIERRELHRKTAELLTEVSLDFSPDTQVDRLSTGESQLVEIAKALSLEAKVIIFDEPTTSLSARESELLFAVIDKLRKRNLAIIYISHVLTDVFRMCNEIVVLRDGLLVASGPVEEFNQPRLISAMVGRSLDRLYPIRRGKPSAEPALEISGLTAPHVVRDIELTVNRGQIVGMAGLMGAGRSELARIIFGLDSYDTGEIRVCGKSLPRGKPLQRIARGVAFLTEDRRTDGLCLEASISENLGLVTWRSRAAGLLRLINNRSWQAEAKNIASVVHLNKKARLRDAVRTLSGGNQQKIALGKWLMARPNVLILDEPTRGVDVGAKFELYELINQLADEGAGILLISSEIEELLGLCDQILVMNRGVIADRIQRSDFDRERILKMALPNVEAHL